MASPGDSADVDFDRIPDLQSIPPLGHYDGSEMSYRFPPGDYEIIHLGQKIIFTSRYHHQNRMPSGMTMHTPREVLHPSAAFTQLTLVRVTIKKDGTSVLGKGAYGEVSLGDGLFNRISPANENENWTITKKVAVKVIEITAKNIRERRRFDSGEEVIYSYPLEFLFLSTLCHPNVTLLYDYALEIERMTPVRWYAFMEACMGGDLFEYACWRHWYGFQFFDDPPPWSTGMPRYGAISELVLRGWAHQFLLALHFCDHHGIAHMDIKPENILLDRHGTVKLADFGLGYPLLADLTDGRRRRIPSNRGTFLYYPPELLRMVISRAQPPWEPIDIHVAQGADGHLCDMYSFAFTIYYSLVGEPPFREIKDGPKISAPLMLEERSRSKEWLNRIRSLPTSRQISEELIAVFETLFTADPNQRPRAGQLLASCRWFWTDSDPLGKLFTSTH